mmetsp:Transcript_27997/g.73854  ORF Transcript_27997/g.73854 Transcript_27997/m.73854 type:complete len:200 (+) Transcript_27997:323-922(+)
MAFRGVRSPSLHQIAHSRPDVPLFASQAIVDRAEGRLLLDILVERDMDLAAGALFEARNRTRAPVHTPRSAEKMPAPLAQAAPVREEHSPRAVLAVLLVLSFAPTLQDPEADSDHLQNKNRRPCQNAPNWKHRLATEPHTSDVQPCDRARTGAPHRLEALGPDRTDCWAQTCLEHTASQSTNRNNRGERRASTATIAAW